MTGDHAVPPAASGEHRTRYSINYLPLFSALRTIDVGELAKRVTEPWYNQTLTEVGGVAIRLGVMQGQFHWHKHDEQDEFFFLLDGVFVIELEGRDPVELRPWQAFTVPAGMRHRPVVPVRSTVLMIERANVVATGD